MPISGSSTNRSDHLLHLVTLSPCHLVTSYNPRMDSLAFLDRASKVKIGPLYVLHGDEPFLKRQVLKAIRERALGPDSDDQTISTHDGENATFAAVFDELQTAPFFHARRLVYVEDADDFVSNFRSVLEKKISDLPATGTLILDVKTWPANTRLAKMVDDSATIVCKSLQPFRVAQWCVNWASSHYQKQLTTEAAGLLADLIGAELGQLDQELQKLTIYVGTRTKITPEDVDRLVGQSRAESTWKIFDAIAAGNRGEAFALLDRLFDQGEEPMKMLGAFSSQLRRLAQAARLNKQGTNLAVALQRAGVPPFALRGAEDQLRHLGMRRVNRLYDWLLEVNLGLKGGSTLPARTLMERFLVRLAVKN